MLLVGALGLLFALVIGEFLFERFGRRAVEFALALAGHAVGH